MRKSAEMELKYMKRKTVIILIIVLAIILAVSVILCYFFLPRSLTRLVPMEGVDSIYYEYDGTDTERQVLLTEQNQQELRNDLSTMKYRPTNMSPEKAVPYRWLCILYDDGTVIKIEGRRVEKKKDGTTKVYSIKLISNSSLFRFFPDFFPEVD